MPSPIAHLPSAQPLPGALASTRARILLVDDVPQNLTAMAAVLEPLGQELVLASSGDEALKALLAEDFALILMDVQMPGLNGLETAALIRARERTRHIPIIFVTALSREAAYVTRGYEAGGVDYLLKPLDPDILRSKVAVFVELYLRGEQLKRQALEISERRRVEAELQRGAALEQHLVAMVGHDIRTPLSAILLTAKAELEREALPEPQRRAFERVLRGAERLRGIAEGVLDFTRERVGQGIPVVRRPSDLHALCRRIVDELHAAHPGRTIECTLDGEALLGEWDPDRIGQVLANLLDNALKYSPKDLPVRLRTRALETAVSFLVENQGVPIPEEKLPRLFEPFERAAAEVEAGRSVGLGLYIARAIVRAHEGTIQVRSGPEGTAFEVWLPREKRPGEGPCLEARSA